MCFAHAVACFLLISTVGAQNPATPRQADTPEQKTERIHRALEPAREMLRARGFDIDLDEMFLHGWTKTFTASVDSIQEMHESLYVTKPLAGVYLADTLYLPEHVELASDTVILGNHVVFEGKDVLVKGAAVLHLFPRYPTEVIHDSLVRVLKDAGLALRKDSAPSLEELARGLKLDIYDGKGRYRHVFEPGKSLSM